MHYVPKQNHSVENLVGLSLVVAIHIVVFYFLATALVSGVTAVRPPQPINIVNIDAPPKPPVPISDPVSAPKSMLSLEPLIFDHKIETIEPPAHAAADQVRELDARHNPPNTADIGKSGAGTTVAPAGVLGIACPNAQRVREEMGYPPSARREGIQGDVLVRFMVGIAGEIKNINIISSSNRALSNAAVSAVKQFSCAPQGQDVAVEVPFSFRLND